MWITAVPDIPSIFDGEHCPNCHKGRVRQVKSEDPCYLTEKGSPWDGMLEDVLRQNDIPFMTGGCLGAGLSTYVGSIPEVARFYVGWSDLEKAGEIVEALFGEDSGIDTEAARYETCEETGMSCIHPNGHPGYFKKRVEDKKIEKKL